MKTILVIPPYYPLAPPAENESINKEPNSDTKAKPLLMPYFLFFLKSCSFLLLDYELSVFKKPNTLSSCIELIVSQKPKKLIFWTSKDHKFDNYNTNTQNLIQKIKLLYPDIKIEILNQITFGQTNDNNQKKLLQIITYTKRNSQKLLVVQDLVYLKDIYKILNQEIYDFWFYNYKKDKIKDIQQFKKDYFDLNFCLSAEYESITLEQIKTLVSCGLEKLILELNINCEFLTCFLEHLEKIKTISEICKLEIDISPDISKINNLEFIEFLNALENAKIEYQIKQTNTNIETKKQFGNFGFISLLSALDNNQQIQRLNKQIPIMHEKTTFEQIIDFILRTENKYLEVYIDIAHFLDGFFTKEEIIDYLNRLHPNSKKENLEKIVSSCIDLLEKEMFVDYLNSKREISKSQKQTISHYASVFPRFDNLLMYGGSEKGYIFGKHTQKLEEVPKDVFFFFVFSKGIFVLNEVASKLHLLFKDTKEYSKENYLKTTKKIYNTLKHYGLCK